MNEQRFRGNLYANEEIASCLARMVTLDTSIFTLQLFLNPSLSLFHIPRR